MNRLLDGFLRRAIKLGTLEVVFADGKTRRYGDDTGDLVRGHFTTAAAERAVIVQPELKLGEEWMKGGFVVEVGTLYDFVDLIFRNRRSYDPAWWMKLELGTRFITRRLRQMNTPIRARRNVHRHYDLDGRLYSLFLDNDLQYSCAYYEEPGIDLDQAQLAKKRHLAAKLALKPGQRILDIGSGWGGLGLYLADRADVEVTGVTLSKEQLAVSNARATERGLSGRVRFHLQDYRDAKGPFDRIVSVGMFEHVGVGHYREFFRTCRDLLTPDGVLVLHSIGRFDGPGSTNPWMQKHIFPGCYVPAVSEVTSAIERSGMLVTDMEILRLHYAATARTWRERFMARRDQAKAMYDERFCRMWEFYLVTAEASFRHAELMNFQIQVAKQLDSLPLTRGYMIEAEEALRADDLRATDRGRLKIAGE